MCAAEAPFEQPLADLRRRIKELEDFPEGAGRRREIGQLEKELEKRTREIYGKLSRWEMTLVARHADRPYTNDYIEQLTEDWLEVHGDRTFADDPAIVAGFARFRDRRVAIIGHQKGRSTRQRIARNFGQPRPEGYRKALRVMRLAERFGLPILTFVDTPGAYPGIGAEERGQAQAIAQNLMAMAALRVPLIVTITGEGGSGGALAIGVGNRVLMLQYSIYSVISPEGCAAILWKEQSKREEAAEAMKISAPDLEPFGIIDEIIEEPPGGAHTDVAETCRRVGEAVGRALDELTALSGDELVAQRYDRFRSLGVFVGG
ncbi:MAG: acetyl-CoA carboxylase carboxyltransferase subunit alpha [Acidobacteria bacterium]|nr:acetyl-CoA carboxylase carboxyltransferase subunit alpha [Acidobacteriota bacterium]